MRPIVISQRHRALPLLSMSGQALSNTGGGGPAANLRLSTRVVEGMVKDE